MHPEPGTTQRSGVDRLAAIASAVCLVHCILTGLALGLLSVAGLGILGSIEADLAFLSVALGLGAVAIVHGIRKHHSILPAIVFVVGLAFIVVGHFGFGHDGSSRPLAVGFSIAGGACLVLFHIVNQRLRHRCSCDHCRTGH